MNELSRYLIGQFLVPVFSLGMVTAGFFLFLNTVTVFPQRKYFSILTLTAISFFYILFEILSKQALLFSGNLEWAIFWDRSQGMVRLFYLIGIPFFLHEFVFISPFFNRLHYLMLVSSITATLIFTGTALLRPDWYIHYNEIALTESMIMNFTLRNTPTHLYLISEGFFLVIFIYTFIAVIVDLVRNPKASELRFLLIGTVISCYFFIASIWKSFTGSYLPPLEQLQLSRVNMGLMVLTLFVYLGIFRYFLKKSREVSDTKDQLFKSQKDLIRMAYTDELTQVGNRFAYMKELENILSKNDLKSAVIQMDIDHFMDLNESYGHDIGDHILKVLSRRFKENLPSFVKTYRTGGDEFAFILTQISNEDTPVEIAILLQNWMNQGVSVEGENYNLEGSLGICYTPQHGIDINGVTKNLNSALKTAKIRGKRIEVFNQNLQHQSVNRILTVQGLKNSIRNNEFYLVYQPVLNGDKKIIGVEALLRWKKPTMGFQSPMDFIPLAESAGLMGELGNLVIEAFVKDFQELRESGKNLYFSINISPVQFYSSTLCDQILFLFSKNDIPLEMIQFEITETLFMEQWRSAVDTINCFREKGIKIALDDFGTGYSSLKYMKELPVDTLKIDKSFLTQIPKDVKATTLLRTIINLASTFNLVSIAEGVEREEQFRFLKSEGCDQFQGFHFHHPLTLEALKKQLENS